MPTGSKAAAGWPECTVGVRQTGSGEELRQRQEVAKGSDAATSRPCCTQSAGERALKSWRKAHQWGLRCLVSREERKADPLCALAAPAHHPHTDGATHHATTPMLYSSVATDTSGGTGERLHGVVVFICSGVGTVPDVPGVVGGSSSLSLRASL